MKIEKWAEMTYALAEAGKNIKRVAGGNMKKLVLVFLAVVLFFSCTSSPNANIEASDNIPYGAPIIWEQPIVSKNSIISISYKNVSNTRAIHTVFTVEWVNNGVIITKKLQDSNPPEPNSSTTSRWNISEPLSVAESRGIGLRNIPGQTGAPQTTNVFSPTGAFFISGDCTFDVGTGGRKSSPIHFDSSRVVPTWLRKQRSHVIRAQMAQGGLGYAPPQTHRKRAR